jgi:hypothetical protein
MPRWRKTPVKFPPPPPMARQPFGGLCCLIFRGFTITHFLDIPHSVGLLCTSDQPVAETSTWQHTTLTSMPPVRFEPAIPVSEMPQTHALDRAATGIDIPQISHFIIKTSITATRFDLYQAIELYTARRRLNSSETCSNDRVFNNKELCFMDIYWCHVT